MLKPLTLSLGLVLALGMSGVSRAGGHAKPSPQDPILASGQSAAATPCEQSAGGCDVLGSAKKSCALFDLFKKKPKCYTYEWVLKKKRVRHGLFGLGDCGGKGCGEGLGSCDSCGGEIYPSSQGPLGSPQGGPAPYAAPQYLSTSQTYGAGQASPAGQLGLASPAPAAAAAPVAAPAPLAPADPSLTPPPAPRDAVPSIPSTPPAPGIPDVPAAPAAPAPPTADAGGLLYLSPAGN